MCRPLLSIRLVLGFAAALLLVALAEPHLWAWHCLRESRRELGKNHPDRASQMLATPLRVWPWSPGVHLLASRAARQAGELETADRELRACQKLLGEATEDTAFEWALLQATAGNVREVEEYLQRQADRTPAAMPVVWEALAEGYLRLYRNSDAMNCLAVWLERDPDNVRALELRGRTFVAGKGVVRGAEDYRRALVLDPTRAQTRWRLIECLINLGAYDEAATLLESAARERPDDPQIASRLARCYNVLNRRDEARALLDRALAQSPDDGPCLRVRGQIALTDPLDPQAAQAEAWIRRAAERFPNDYQTQWLLFEALRRQGKDNDAKEQRLKAEAVKDRSERISELSSRKLGEQPLDPALHYEMGLLLISADRGEAGERWLLSAVALDPTHKPAHTALAQYYEQSGNKAKAEEHRAIVAALSSKTMEKAAEKEAMQK